MKLYLLIVVIIINVAFLQSQSLKSDVPTSSFEINIGSMRPLGIYADNLPKEGLLDVGLEFQSSLNQIFKGERKYFPLSLGMKIGYNYFTLEKEETGDQIWDTTGVINWFRSEYTYTLRSHALNFHPLLELSTPLDKKVVGYIKGYVGATTSWATSKLRHIQEDNTGAITKDKSRSYSVNRWTFDYGYKAGVLFKLAGSFFTISYTRIWGGEIEYLGEGSVNFYDPTDPSKVEIEPIKSTTDRYIVQMGVKWVI